jgi:hypothetical protein
MSEEKEPSAKGFGLRLITENIEQKKLLAAWLEDSAAWREGFQVQHLAQWVSSELRDEQLALIVAQLWLERQSLRAALETAIRGLDGKISVADAAAFTFQALKAKQKQNTSKRMAGGLDEHNKQVAIISAEIKRHAKELWDNDIDKEYRVAEMAGLVRSAVERDHPGESPGLDRIKVLIRPLAPEYARAGGAPKGPRKRSKP